MRTGAIVMMLSLVLMSPMGTVQAGTLEAGKISNDPVIDHDKKQENACDCCQKCKAAKSDVETEEEEGALEGDGCEDCCTRCGKPLEHAPEETPPDIIDKKAPPDIIEKKKESPPQ